MSSDEELEQQLQAEAEGDNALTATDEATVDTAETPTEAKRGRGRPRKPDHLKKIKQLSGRPRGRPPMPEHLKKAKPATGKPRGRPKMADSLKKVTKAKVEKVKKATAKPAVAKGTGRSRGRPRKSESS